MNDYLQSIVARAHSAELLREAESERLARRVRVHRNGTVSIARKLVAGIGTVFARQLPTASPRHQESRLSRAANA